jgi:hypothetical protein
LVEKSIEYSIKESIDGCGKEFPGHGSERSHGKDDEVGEKNGGRAEGPKEVSRQVEEGGRAQQGYEDDRGQFPVKDCLAAD